MYRLTVCLVALAAAARAYPEEPVYAPGHASLDYYAYPKYAYDYSVKDPHTGDNKAAWEQRDGDAVKGAYSLVEPDGTLRVVDYWADDKHGFNAVVKRVGPNHHPIVAPVPLYKAPIPILEGLTGLGPHTVGPVANLGRLSEAPLLSGHSGAVSSQTIIRKDYPVKAVPVAPLPILAPAPIIRPALAPYGPALYPAPYRPDVIRGPLVEPIRLAKYPVAPQWGAGLPYSSY